ncbi:MAG: hypothetical protein AAGL90_02195 [Pseudomonadota bacterium]
MLRWLKRGNRASDTPVEAPEMAERRRSNRRDVYADAVAISNSGRFLKKGIALDLSSDGTRLRFENGDSLLDGMTVNIARYGIKRRARMCWRTRTDVGVEFIDEAD